jgi:hypothetical protein
MRPFRRALEELGFTAVESYGTSGNLLFNSARSATRQLERRIARRLGKAAFVRTRSALGRVVAQDPFRDRGGVSALPRASADRRTAARVPRAGVRRASAGAPGPDYYVYPARLRGRRTPFDFERTLGVRGTFRTSRVVDRLLARMSEA